MSLAPAQLALRFPPRRRCTLEGFESGSNPELLDRLRPSRGSREFGVIWIVGETGAGKSHLLQAACAAMTQAGGSAAYLPADLIAIGPGVFDGLDHLDRIAIDDLPRWLGDKERETAMLGLYQGLLARAASLVVAADISPARAAFSLPDLASRLRAAETLGLTPLDDAARVRLMERLARERGFEIPVDVLDYLLRRGPRKPGDIADLVERLDARSLEQRRRLTVPLVRALLIES